jgi:hypothetical protein
MLYQQTGTGYMFLCIFLNTLKILSEFYQEYLAREPLILRMIYRFLPHIVKLRMIVLVPLGGTLVQRHIDLYPFIKFP